MSKMTEIPPQDQPQSGKLFDYYSPIDVREATGTFFLGILALILLFLFIRSNRRYLDLMQSIGPNKWVE